MTLSGWPVITSAPVTSSMCHSGGRQAERGPVLSLFDCWHLHPLGLLPYVGTNKFLTHLPSDFLPVPRRGHLPPLPLLCPNEAAYKRPLSLWMDCDSSCTASSPWAFPALNGAWLWPPFLPTAPPTLACLRSASRWSLLQHWSHLYMPCDLSAWAILLIVSHPSRLFRIVTSADQDFGFWSLKVVFTSIPISKWVLPGTGTAVPRLTLTNRFPGPSLCFSPDFAGVQSTLDGSWGSGLWKPHWQQGWLWPLMFSEERFLALAAAAKSLQSCPTLCDHIDGSPPASPVPGILQARTLEWVAISFSNAWKWKV